MNLKHLVPLPIVALAALLLTPVAGFAQTILLSAANFTLLGGTAITSTGVVGTIIKNGNVGLSPGATTGITGFPPAVITGGAIIATGAVTAQARLDLITASVGLAGMPSNANMSNIDLGGKTLSPGVYTFNGAASQNGALVLDAQGHNNVAWVFQIGTALTTSINSTVTFINLGSNGGSDLGVFWNAGSAVNIGANNQIAGNYLAGTSIVFGSLSAGGGRALALAGVSLDNDVVDAQAGPGGGGLAGGLRYDPSGAVIPGGGSGSITTVPTGTLGGGSGTIGGGLVNSGILSPGILTAGPTAGPLNVASSFTQDANGTLLIQIASGTTFNQLLVAGTATLAGKLQVDVLNGFDPIGLSFPVLIATGGVSGTFDTYTGNAFTTNRAAVGTIVTYSPTTVTVAFTQLPFAGFAFTPNQRAVANAAQASPALTVALDAVPLASQFPAALNALSPQGYEIWSEAAFADATSLTDRLQYDDRATPGHDYYYVDASQRRARAQADADVGASTFTSTAGLVGVDHFVNSGLTGGAFFDYNQTTAGLGTPDSSTKIKSKMLGARATWSQGAWFERAVLAYSFDHYSTSRPVVFPGTTALATGGTDGHHWIMDVTAGRRFNSGIFTLSPFAGLQLTKWRADGFTETGAGAFNVTVADQSAHSLRSQLGLEVGLDWRFGLLVIHPHLRAAWLSEFANDARAMRAAFGPIDYDVVTRGPVRDSALGSVGLDVELSPRTILYTDLTAQSGGVTKYITEWRAGMAINF